MAQDRLFILDAICGQYNYEINEYCIRPPHPKKSVHESDGWFWYGMGGECWEKTSEERG